MTETTEKLEFTAPAVIDDEISEYSFDSSGATVLAFFRAHSLNHAQMNYVFYVTR